MKRIVFSMFGLLVDGNLNIILQLIDGRLGGVGRKKLRMGKIALLQKKNEQAKDQNTKWPVLRDKVCSETSPIHGRKIMRKELHCKHEVTRALISTQPFFS